MPVPWLADGLDARLPRPRHWPRRQRWAPRVRLVGRLDALTAPGGGEVQLQATAEALRRLGWDARPWRPWEEPLEACDLLHFFGSLPQHAPLMAAARQRGIPVALSPIAWFDIASRWHVPRWSQRLRGVGGMLLRRAIPRWPSWRRRLYQAADILLPNSQAEAQQLVRLFRVGMPRIHVVPNGADPRFAAARPGWFDPAQRGFVLCTGRIEPRKNQWTLLRALRGTGVSVVILGDAVPGHEDYLAACHRTADSQVRFLPGMAHDDPRLAGAYAACGCLALVSWFETPGLAALEAAMTGTPLVLTRRGCAEEYFGPHARYVSPGSHREIRRAVLNALRSPRDSALAERTGQCFTWQQTALATQAAYEKILR